MIAYITNIPKLQFLFITVAVLIAVYYSEVKRLFQHDVLLFGGTDGMNGGKSVNSIQSQYIQLFTKQELSAFNGEKGFPIYLALLGKVYDVSKGAKHYGPGCAYSYFAGRDGSVSFITGNFKHSDEEADDVLNLKQSELLSLSNWQQFYDAEYIYKGKLVGRFYDCFGKHTPYHYKYMYLLEQAQNTKTSGEELRLKYPDCNIEWSELTGSRVWCTVNSGGKERSWMGYPRKLFQVGSDSFRCACLRSEDLETTDVIIKLYEDCGSLSHECYYRVD